jgi:hypothetical protein
MLKRKLYKGYCASLQEQLSFSRFPQSLMSHKIQLSEVSRHVCLSVSGMLLVSTLPLCVLFRLLVLCAMLVKSLYCHGGPRS